MENKKKCKIYLAGVGGQGVVTAAKVIGEAAMKEGLNPVMSEVHGMSQRGGIVVSSIVINGGNSPLIGTGDADILIGFEPLEALRSIEKIKKEGSIIVSTYCIYPYSVIIGKAKYPSMDEIIDIMNKFCVNIFPLNTREIAERAGSPKVENATLLGALTKMKGFSLPSDAILSSLLEIIPPKYHSINKKGFELGIKAIEDRKL